MVSQIVLIAHNIRSSHNVGSLLRTADGLGVEKVFLTGYTPHPAKAGDKRLPHLAQRQSRQIAKTALGAEGMVDWRHEKDITAALKELKAAGYSITALEQTTEAIPIGEFGGAAKIALIVGSEVGGIDKETLKLADAHLYLPMAGRKESFNVSVAAALALYHLKLKGDGQID